MNLEFKKTLTNKIALILSFIFIFIYLLGYFLPIGIDKVKSLNYSEYFFSTYTVATEFGFLIFSFIISYFINKEYNEKTILFYKVIDQNIFSFFYNKLVVLFLECFLFICSLTVLASILLSDFTHTLGIIYLLSVVVLQYILIIGTISMLSNSILISIGISIVYWITTIILVAINKDIFGFFAPFEASNTIYPKINDWLKTSNSLDVSIIIFSVCYILALAVINMIVLKIFKKRWVKLGV